MRFRVGAAHPTDAAPIRDALLEVEQGRIATLTAWPNRKPPTPFQDRGDWGLLPGLVNAHCHLELSALRNAIPPPDGFAAWLPQLLRKRAEFSDAELREAARRGLAELAASGATTVLDITTTDLALEVAARSGLRIHWFFELIGQRPLRRWQAWRRARRAWREHPDSERLTAHLSPHAPYSTHPTLITKAAEWAARRGRHWGIHLAESPEELELLLLGTGPLRDFLGDFLARGWRPPGLRALTYLARLPWPRERPPLLFHANHLDEDEMRLAARLGVGIVHCPGCHAYFSRSPFPVRNLLEAGIPVLVGTDSLASNQSLDMRREVRLLVAGQDGLSRETAFRMASRDAAAFLAGPGHAVGLAPGAPADLWFWRLSGGLPAGESRSEALLERLLDETDPGSEIHVAGRPVQPREILAARDPAG